MGDVLHDREHSQDVDVVVQLSEMNRAYIQLGRYWGIVGGRKKPVICQRVGSRRREVTRFGNALLGMHESRVQLPLAWHAWTDLFTCEVVGSKVAWKLCENWIYARADDLAYETTRTGQLVQRMSFDLGLDKLMRLRGVMP